MRVGPAIWWFCLDMGSCSSYLSLCNKLPKNLVTSNNNNNFLSHSVHGLGVLEQFSWPEVLAQNLHGVALRMSGGSIVIWKLPGPGEYASRMAHLPGGQVVLIAGGRKDSVLPHMGPITTWQLAPSPPPTPAEQSTQEQESQVEAICFMIKPWKLQSMIPTTSCPLEAGH